MENSKTVLVIIDVQNDYFPGGGYPLWNTDTVLTNVEKAVYKAGQKNMPVILVQHIANRKRGPAPFFNEGTQGVKIHRRLLSSDIPLRIVKKQQADSFSGTDLKQLLDQSGADHIIIGGMMTQNCVTHTALSRQAEQYRVSVLSDCCTSIDEMIHNMALRALSARVGVVTLDSL